MLIIAAVVVLLFQCCACFDQWSSDNTNQPTAATTRKYEREREREREREERWNLSWLMGASALLQAYTMALSMLICDENELRNVRKAR